MKFVLKLRPFLIIFLSGILLMACNRMVLQSGPNAAGISKTDQAEKVVPPPAWDPDAEPGSPGLPLQYLGPELPDIEASDGRLMYNPGVQNIQISRVNRKYPPSFPA